MRVCGEILSQAYRARAPETAETEEACHGADHNRKRNQEAGEPQHKVTAELGADIVKAHPADAQQANTAVRRHTPSIPRGGTGAAQKKEAAEHQFEHSALFRSAHRVNFLRPVVLLTGAKNGSHMALNLPADPVQPLSPSLCGRSGRTGKSRPAAAPPPGSSAPGPALVRGYGRHKDNFLFFFFAGGWIQGPTWRFRTAARTVRAPTYNVFGCRSAPLTAGFPLPAAAQ